MVCNNGKKMKKKYDMSRETAGDGTKTAGRWRRAGKALAWIFGIWAALLILVQIVLSPAVLTRIANSYSDGYVDGDIRFGSASASMFTHFPSLTLSFDDFSITYDPEKFDTLEQAGVQGLLMYHGCSDAADTLVSFKRLSACIRVAPLLSGKVVIPHAELVKPRVFAHCYHDGSANWNIFYSESGEDDESGFTLPDLTLGRITLSEHPHIVYTDCCDTVFAMIDVRQAELSGRLSTSKAARSRAGFSLDSMFVAGRVGHDTLALGLDRLHIHEHGKHMDVSARAHSWVGTRMFGRMNVPMELKGSVSFPKDSVFAVSVHGMTAKIAEIPVKADADIRLCTGRTEINGSLLVRDCVVSDVLNGFVCNFFPQARDISTDAAVTLSIDVNGCYNHAGGGFPDFTARISVPESSVRYAGFPSPVRLNLEASAASGEDGKINLTVEKAVLSASGIHLHAAAGVGDVLGDDPEVSIDGRMTMAFDSLRAFMPDSLNLLAYGKVNAEINGRALMSQLDMYSFSMSAMTGEITGEDIVLKAPDDTIDIAVSRFAVRLGPESMASRRDSTKSWKMMALKGDVDSVNIEYKKALKINGKDIAFTARNSAEQSAKEDGSPGYLGGRLNAGKLAVSDASGASVLLDMTENSFSLIPKKGHPELPTLTLRSKNKRIMLNADVNRAILTDASIKARAAMNTLERKARRKVFLDSLARVYPGVAADSLVIYARKNRESQPVPEWMKEEDFKKKDIDIRLDETLAKYFREWDLDGNIGVRTGILMTPYFPLRNIVRGFDCGFNNNEISIDSLKIMAGGSEIAAKGKLTGLRRALLGRGRLNLDLDIQSEKMDAEELLNAYNSGMNFNPEESRGAMEEASNSEFLKMVTSDAAASDAGMPLIVVPSNLTAHIGMHASGIKYSGLDISDACADILMKERCLQILNTAAVSNVGILSFDGFYATRTKKDIETGFSLNLSDITAEKVIELLPAVDTLMPMLKSFSGLLNCELAATARLDTNMNVIPPSINGIVRIGGRDLSIGENELFQTLARKMMFKNKNEGYVQKMTVEGVIKDNVLEIFPFVMNVDRYTIAMSGVQNLDLSFRYHVSVLKSPFLFRLGLDFYGQDFDHLKFKLGKAKYKNTNVPVFSTVIDKAKINLVTSIKGIFEKGVDAAMRENETQNVISEHKKSIGYVKAVDQELEELSADERRQMEAQEAAERGQAEVQEASEAAAEDGAAAEVVLE